MGDLRYLGVHLGYLGVDLGYLGGWLRVSLGLTKDILG